MTEANRLSDLVVEEIAVCRKGINRLSKKVLHKAEPDQGDAHTEGTMGCDHKSLKPGKRCPNCGMRKMKKSLIDGDHELDALLLRSRTVLAKAEFSDKQREKLAGKKQAMPGGGYPIRNVSDLKNAIQAIGRAKDPAATKAWIIKRAKALGAEDLIPEGWVTKARLTKFNPNHDPGTGQFSSGGGAAGGGSASRRRGYTAATRREALATMTEIQRNKYDNMGPQGRFAMMAAFRGGHRMSEALRQGLEADRDAAKTPRRKMPRPKEAVTIKPPAFR